jgi:glycosyltransferase involved in cell wall biosynthesis
MKIAINTLVTSQEKIGVGNYLSDLIDRLQSIDHVNTYYIFTAPETRHLFPIRMSNFEEICVSVPTRGGIIALLKTLFWLHTSFLSRCRSLDTDVIHIPNTELMLWKRPTTVVTICDLAEWHTLKYSPLRTAFRKQANASQARRAQRILTISERTKEDLMTILGVPEEKIDVAYLAPSPLFHEGYGREESRNLVNERFGFFGEYILSVASHERHKNVEGLLMAASIIKARRDLPWKIILTGKADTARTSIQKTIRAEHLTEDVVLSGYVPDELLPRLYSGAKTFVFPSFWEGFGLPILEAMACGCPVICANTSALPEVAGEAAILVNPHDPTEIADSLLAIECDRGLEERLRKNGPARAHAFNGWDTATATLRSYRLAAGSRQGSLS